MTHQVEERMIHCLVVTISDTRTVETDKSGHLIKELLAEKNHATVNHVIVPDDKMQIEQLLQTAIEDERVEAVLLTGGTGISKRDITIEVVDAMLEKEIPGFGELFRMLSYTEDIGAAAMMSRATAGILENEKVIFAMPGSSGAVRLAMNKLILPELSHIKQELDKHHN